MAAVLFAVHPVHTEAVSAVNLQVNAEKICTSYCFIHIDQHYS